MKTKRKIIIISFFIATSVFYLFLHAQPNFGEEIAAGVLNDEEINEASGAVASRAYPGTLWTFNDSGGGAEVFAIGVDGETITKFELGGAKNRDWEDISILRDPESGKWRLLIAEIGDNREKYETKRIYIFDEPKPDSAKKMKEIPSREIETISFKYADEIRDAEALAADPNTGNLYIVTKRDKKAYLYEIKYPYNTRKKLNLKPLGKISIGFETNNGGGITAADISPDGSEILLKDYNNVYYFKRAAGKSIFETLAGAPKRLPYFIEPQGESICWNPFNMGYYTLSESKKGIPTKIYFYPRTRQKQ